VEVILNIQALRIWIRFMWLRTRDQWWFLVNKIMKSVFYKRQEIPPPAKRLSAFKAGPCAVEFSVINEVLPVYF
jgi:hypothetical protein